MKRIQTLALFVLAGVAGLQALPLAASQRLATDPAAAESVVHLDDVMTKGKLEADLGHDAAAIEAFETIARQANAPAPFRWEALVRLGVARRRSGDHEGSVDIFREVMRAYPNEPEAIRFLTLAISGVVPGPERWERIWKEIRLTVNRSDARHPVPNIVWPGREETVPESYTGEPISLELKDAALTDVLQRFANLTALKVVMGPEITGTVTARVSRVPWDDVLDRILVSQGMGYHLVGNVVTVIRLDAR